MTSGIQGEEEKDLKRKNLKKSIHTGILQFVHLQFIHLCKYVRKVVTFFYIKRYFQ